MQEQLDSDKKPQNHKLVVYTNKENMEAFNYVNSLTPEEQIIQDELQKGVVLTTAETMNFQEPAQTKEENLKMSLEHPDFLKPERLDEETDYQYQVRKWMQKAYIKQKSNGNFMWIAKDTRLPVYSDEDNKAMENMTKEEKAKVKPIAYKVSKGFSYNKIKVQKAIDKYMTDKPNININKTI